MQLQLANFVRGRLSAGITAAATSIPLTTAAFPALAQGTFCYAVLQSATDRSVVEIVKVTAGGATLTVERGQEGTTARDFAANDIIEQRLTAIQFQSVVDHSNAANSHVPAGEAGKFLKGVAGGVPDRGGLRHRDGGLRRARVCPLPRCLQSRLRQFAARRDLRRRAGHRPRRGRGRAFGRTRRNRGRKGVYRRGQCERNLRESLMVFP